jgi:ParB family chromosome partitioning protein
MTDPTTTPATLVHIDPTTLLDHPSNVRDDLGDLNELTASIRHVGVLEPLVVVPTDDGHRILTGHRRKAAAIAAGLTTVPCYERPDLADDRDQLLAILIENLRRDDLSELEEARGYQQLLDLGLSATKIAKATGTPRARVRDALAVTKSDTALTTAATHGLTLDQALVLTEFADDHEALATLTDSAVEDPDGLLHVASRIRQDRERQGQYERLVAEHEAAGVTILDQRPDSYSTKALGVPRTLDALVDGDDQALDADRHASCPGHGVWIETSSWHDPRPIYACVDPQTYGHRNRYGTGGENKLPEDAKAERREVIENNKAWRAAEPVRRDHIRSLLAAGKVPKGTLRFITAEIMADPAEIGRGSDEMIAQLAGITAEPTETDLYRRGRTAGPTLAAKASDARLPLVLLAQVAAAREQSMDVHTWRSTNAQAEARWLNYLAATGYPLSPIEQTVIDKTAAASDDPEDQPSTAESPGREASTDETAA